MVKVLRNLLLLAVSLIVLLFVAAQMAFGVGHLNFAVTRGDLAVQARLAEAVPLKPGEGFGFEYTAGRLVATPFGRTHVSRDAEGRLFLRVETGGGHLGSQGYVYMSDAGLDVLTGPSSPVAEGRAYRRVSLNWWSYDSTEE